MKSIKVLAIAAMTVAATMLPLSASANVAPPTPPDADPAAAVVVKQPSTPGTQVAYHGPGVCRHAWIFITATRIAARVSKSTTAPEAFPITGGPGLSACRSFEVGELYGDFCGRANTGWILVAWLEGERQGWIPSQCTLDPVLG